MHSSCIPNSSAIPNILFDYWMKKLSPPEFKVLMCIARKAYGWSKDSDAISLKQIQKMTSLSKNLVAKTIDALISHGLLIKIAHGDDVPTRYTINSDCMPPETSDEDLPEKKEEKKNKGEEKFSTQVREITNRMIELAMENEPTYRPPKDLTAFMKCVQDMVENEKQDVDTLLKSFEWAVSDGEQRGEFNGWRGVICTNLVKGRITNPAKQFHRNLTKINSARQARPKRKFSPSSNDEAAIAIMEDMAKRAI